MGLVAYRDRGDAYVTQVDRPEPRPGLDVREAHGLRRRRRRRRAGGRQRSARSRDPSHVVEPGPEHVQGRVLGRRRAAAHGLPGRREVPAGRRGRGRERHRRQHDPVRQHERHRRAVAAHRELGPRPLLHRRAGRQRRRDRDAVRCADRDALRASSTPRASTTARPSSAPRWPRRSTRRSASTRKRRSPARARRGAFNVSESGAGNFFGEQRARRRRRERPRRRRRRAGRGAAAGRRRAAGRSSSARCSTETAQKREELQRQIASLAAERDAYIEEELEAAGGADARSISRSTRPCASRRRRSAWTTRTDRAFDRRVTACRGGGSAVRPRPCVCGRHEPCWSSVVLNSRQTRRAS